jgi:hypothetical protein
MGVLRSYENLFATLAGRPRPAANEEPAGESS